jgi:Zn finger protein HypA/HybF involved in hydrogenase expression
LSVVLTDGILVEPIAQKLRAMQITCSKCGFNQEAQPDEMFGHLHLCEQCHSFFSWAANGAEDGISIDSVVKQSNILTRSDS